jgi:UDP-hydrolysing UDP-N-acetyl-D-glucosamine 2-epimerase
VRTIAIVTTGRSDYYLLTPVARALARRRRLRVRWLVTGQHASARPGSGVQSLRQDRWRSVEVIETLIDGDTPPAVSASIGVTTEAFARVFSKERPDLLVVLGDRFELLGVVSAAVPFRLPIAHIHGGETTFGAFDENIRHAITKLSHLHFVAHPAYGARVRQLGEERWRVVVSGAPGLDRARARRSVGVGFDDVERRLGTPIGRDTLLVTYHPETLRPERSGPQLAALLQALGRVDRPTIFTAPNADPGHEEVLARVEAFVAAGPRRALVSNLGERYFALLGRVGAMVGNSSSGVIEAPSFRLPVVNVGRRQEGRMRAPNVIDVEGGSRRIEAAIRRALSPSFRARLTGRNPFGDGRAGERIARVLATIPLDDRLRTKRFVDARRLG